MIPKNPADFRDGELTDLERALRAALPRRYVVALGERPGSPPGARGVTWYEVLNFLTSLEPLAKGAAGHAAGRALDALLNVVVRWVKQKRKRRPDNRRPTYAVILGPHGEVLKAILVDADGKVTDTTADEIRMRQPYAPPLVSDGPPGPRSKMKRPRR